MLISQSVAEDVDERMPAHRILFFDALQHRHMVEAQLDLVASTLERECQVRLGIGGNGVRCVSRCEDVPGIAQAVGRGPLSDGATDMSVHQPDSPTNTRLAA